MTDKKQELFTKLIKHSKQYKTEETYKNLFETKDKILEVFKNHFEPNKMLLNEIYAQNPEIIEENNVIKRVIDLKNEIGKENELLTSGNVAAIDGTTKFNIDSLLFVHYVSMVIGSVSYTKQSFSKEAQHWDSTIDINDLSTELDDVERLFSMIEIQQNKNIPKNDFMLFKERELSLSLEASHIFLDGPIFMEQLLSYKECVDLYKEIINSDKRYIGIIKDISKNNELNLAAETLRSGEARIVAKTEDHFNKKSSLPLSEFYRGVFKIRNKGYGFEVHKSILIEMLTLVFNDCKDYGVYEIPWLLSIIDKGIKQFNETEQTLSYLLGEVQKKHPDFWMLNINERKLR